MSKEYVTLAQAARLSPTHPSTNAVWRWCRRGIKSRSGKRICLSHVRVGGRIFTTRDDMQEFFDAVTESDSEYFDRDIPPPSFPNRSEKQRAKTMEAASNKLRDVLQ